MQSKKVLLAANASHDAKTANRIMTVTKPKVQKGVYNGKMATDPIYLGTVVALGRHLAVTYLLSFSRIYLL